MVVIALIGLLSAVVMASLNGARVKARDARRSADIRQFKTAMELYHNDTRMYPPGRTSAGAAIADNSGGYLGYVIQYDLSAYLTAPLHDPQFSYVSGDYQYVRSPGSQAYGVRIRYEKLGPGFCKTGVEVNMGWWGGAVPLCESVL